MLAGRKLDGSTTNAPPGAQVGPPPAGLRPLVPLAPVPAALPYLPPSHLPSYPPPNSGRQMLAKGLQPAPCPTQRSQPVQVIIGGGCLQCDGEAAAASGDRHRSFYSRALQESQEGGGGAALSSSVCSHRGFPATRPRRPPPRRLRCAGRAALTARARGPRGGRGRGSLDPGAAPGWPPPFRR